MKMFKEVADRIRFYRKVANLTQEQLSELVEIDRSYLGKIERGEINISLETISRIADALKIEPIELFERPLKSYRKDKKEVLEKINVILESQTTEELKMTYIILNDVRKYKEIR